MSAQFHQNNAVLTAGRDINSNNTISETHIHPPAQPPAPLPSLRRCPLPSSRFTGRKAELDKMTRFFFREELKRCNFSIIGIGGCGKSQLAFQFVHYHVLEKLKFDPSMVFFVDATTTATLEESWKAIAETRGIGDTARAALDYLSNSQTLSFVLVDNADDPNISLRNYLPRSTKSYVLITSRLARARSYGSGEDSFIDLQALREEDAEELLMTTAELGEADRLSVRELLGELHCHALAVVQAAAGIRVLHLPVQEYIRLFRQHRTALMDGQKDGVNVHDLNDYRWTVQSAYRISVSHLSESSSAKRLLGLMGHLHHNGIKEEFFRRAFERVKTYKPAVPLSPEEASALSLLRELLATFSAADGSWDSLAFKRAIGPLISLSLVTYDEANGYQIHPLICDALRYDHPEPLLAAFLLTLAYFADVDDTVFNHHLSPHAERMLASLDEANLHPDLASGLGRICAHLDQGRKSESLLRMALSRCRREAGENTSSTLGCMAALSYILHRAGRYTEGRELDQQILEKRRLLLGPDHPQTVRAMANLATDLYVSGRYDEAKRMGKQVLEKRTVLLGPDHPQTVDAMAHSAITLHSLGRYDEAERVNKQVLEKRTVLLGPDNPDTVTAMNNLAVILHSLGRYDEAERMYKQVLEKRTVLFGPDHPQTVNAMSNLAATLHSLGRYDEAERMTKKVLENRTLLLGPDHPQTIDAMAKLAVTLHSLGRYDEAEQTKKQVLEKRTVLLSPDHPHTVDAMANLAATLHSIGRYEETMKMERQVLVKRRLILGSAYPDVGRAMANLSYTVRELGEKKEAQTLMDEAVALLGRTLGQSHPDTIRYRNRSARWSEEDNTDEAPSTARIPAEVKSDRSGSTTVSSSLPPSRSTTPTMPQRLPSRSGALSPSTSPHTSSSTPPHPSPSRPTFKSLLRRIRHSTRLRRPTKEDEIP